MKGLNETAHGYKKFEANGARRTISLASRTNVVEMLTRCETACNETFHKLKTQQPVVFLQNID